jgi:tetratricopeptide (TPR) repeat protein
MQERPAPEQEGQGEAGTAVDAGGAHAGQSENPEGMPVSAEQSRAEEGAEDRTEDLDPFTVFKRAKASYYKCEYDRALGYVNYAIGLDPEQREFYKLKASILNDSPGSSTGSVRALVAVLEKMIRLDPREIDALLQLAELYEAMKMPNKAAKYWQMARTIDPSHSKLAHNSSPGEETWPGIILREATDLGGRAKDKALDWIDRFRR